MAEIGKRLVPVMVEIVCRLVLIFEHRRKAFKPKVIVPSDREEWNSQHAEKPENSAQSEQSIVSSPTINREESRILFC